MITIGVFVLTSCTLFDQQTKKESKEPPAKVTDQPATPPTPPPATTTEPKIQPKKAVEKTVEKPAEKPAHHKAAPKLPSEVEKKKEAGVKLTQQQYYNIGMKHYSQENYQEAKKAWLMVIKLGKRTALANKARENIKKTDQILKTLKEISGK